MKRHQYLGLPAKVAFTAVLVLSFVFLGCPDPNGGGGLTPTYGISLNQTGTHTFPAATAGYGAQTALSVTITNTGNQATGALTATLSGTNSGSFALSTTSISSIVTGGTGSFTVVPKTGLAAGTYTAMVTVSGGNGIAASFDVSFTVTLAPTYGFSLSQTGTHTFPAAIAGYGTQTAKSVTITNTGDQATGALTAALSGANSTSFTLSTAAISSIAVSGTGSFTVVPNTGLAAGTYTATVTVSGGNEITANFNVSFTVNSASVVNAATPSITGQPASSATYTQNATATALTVTATKSDDGTLSYQWYTNTSNSTTGGTAVGTNSASYTPVTSAMGTLYYYVVVTNTNNSVNGTNTATVTSSVAAVTVNAVTGTGKITFTFTGPADETITLGTGQTISWASNGSLTLTVATAYSSYAWYVDGILVSGVTGNTLTINARDYEKKQHTVTVGVTKADGIPYTKVVTFTVGS
ncbi:hypothetical protein FACS1894163_02880 [Spirochaetia bacterium]|nr:hypothetical protein FACS1894163_02880 [Spirochaetia bacterium]